MSMKSGPFVLLYEINLPHNFDILLPVSNFDSNSIITDCTRINILRRSKSGTHHMYTNISTQLIDVKESKQSTTLGERSRILLNQLKVISKGVSQPQPQPLQSFSPPHT